MSSPSEIQSEGKDSAHEHHLGYARYAAYLARIKAVVAVKAAGAARYLAFTSDVGEAVRPVVPSSVVNASYGIAGLYMVGDVAYQGYRANQDGGDVPRTVAQTATFQLLASLAIPVAVIHTAVHQSQHLFRRFGRFTKWGPSLVGLACVPALPALVDEPVEHSIEYLFDTYWPASQSDSQTQKEHEQ
mmetsp:Transcript_12401/g.34823  ORF Transcript_12401/g.34823 Transcript_12401/m.34823 type:complete len:187 (-) Transcript_12401:227-787(-)|eukprot:CAMPEP_0117670368 /NCGR_PEP_ID=MMETSP0804-20121206/12706_1 /TAXON_ID=1074897 /ORGANISM="Tetraselmis astigmatica, Strain CCMP880" /LENGTH=186 /DNA_ID=CAMNT_0005478643 /DNA_START=154 /DNA_END=714 /DNA_ORIENTATION=-